MTKLEVDTLYYRQDHPDGYVFAAGNPAPDPAEGWVEAPHLVEPAPEREFEFATLAEYDGVLRSQRLSNQHLSEQLANQVAENGSLRAENGRLIQIFQAGIAPASQATAAEA